MEEKVFASLHPLERKVVEVLDKAKTTGEIEKATKLSEVEVMRALQWLENRGFLKIKSEEEEFVQLDDYGKDALKHGLVEKRFLHALQTPVRIADLPKKIGIEPQEVNVCLGLLRSQHAILLGKGIVMRTKEGETLLKKEFLEEKFLKILPKETKNMTPQEKTVLEILKKRKQMIKVVTKKLRSIELTALGKSYAGKKIGILVEERLTSQMLKNNTWKGKTFRRYDLAVNVPPITGGKRHFENEAITYIKRIWLDLGFEEMEGNMIQTNFWNLDALFVPQDHPARAMQDTFYVKKPSHGSLPQDLVPAIKAVHEHGGKTGSKGWQSPWNEKVAAENVLRTHTTPLSAQKLATLKKEDLPKKFFSVGKVFRNETLDWSHLFEFYQIDGIVIDPQANFKHLKAYLKEFYKKMGYSDVRLRPAHFPYTEPSVEVDVYDPHHKEWIELGGAGIFRPEVVQPLLGIRDLYKNDLKQMREMKAWLL
ncbi:phenylalanine--tRNA ligase subunit alpha [Candidatus Woesearchaeota archaeon]|nr:phenylalanine--tRNA ligase subunit alpha [Candidatus Woesearchaeota archaeon]